MNTLTEQELQSVKRQIIWRMKAGWVTRRELQALLHCTDIVARQWVANLNVELAEVGLCVLSTARHQGYHIPDPTKKADVQLAEEIERELESKAISIFERRKAIRQFRDRCLTAPRPLHEPSYEQLNLFGSL